jgi:hypothetical protein
MGEPRGLLEQIFLEKKKLSFDFLTISLKSDLPPLTRELFFFSRLYLSKPFSFSPWMILTMVLSFETGQQSDPAHPFMSSARSGRLDHPTNRKK